MEPINSAIQKTLDDAVWAFIEVGRRYPLLLRTSEELDRVRARFRYQFHNDGLMQVLRDSFDMFVIDLYSIRESLVEKGGLLDLVRNNLSCLRRRSPEEFDPGPITVIGVSRERRHEMMPELQEASRRRIAKDINDAIDRLVGPTDPVTCSQVDGLIKRVRAETEPLDRDRNRVRAHRYQRDHQDTSHFINLPDWTKQIETIERYLKNLHLALTECGTSTSGAFMGATGTTHEDLADILVHGSINMATIAYGVAPEEATPTDPAPWYWAKRKAVLTAKGG
jgi:hypothetical protein